MRRVPQVLENVRVKNRMPLTEMPDVQRMMADAEKRLAGTGRLLVRYSGTEMLARVMVEGEDGARSKPWPRKSAPPSKNTPAPCDDHFRFARLTFSGFDPSAFRYASPSAQSHVNRVRYQRMADRHFLQSSHRFHICGNIFGIEIVPRVYAQPDLPRETSGFTMRRENRFALRRAERMRIRTGVQLNSIGAELLCAFDLRGVSIEKKARADARIAKPGEHISQPIRGAEVRFHPALDVSTPGGSGTSVTCVGRTRITRSINSALG